LQRTRTLKIAGFGYYIVVALVGFGVWKIQGFMTSLSQSQTIQQSEDGVIGQALTQLDNVQERQLDAYLEVNRLLTTFGTTLLGALGFLLIGQKRAIEWKRHRWAALAGALCVVISIFFGYVAYLFILSMLRDGIFDLTSSNPHWAQQAHFYTFLAGVVFLGDFVFHNLTNEEEDDALRNISDS
jgi:hypothetical protein